MRVLGFKRFPLAPALALLTLSPIGGEAQLRSVVSSEVGVSENEAKLTLGFQDQGELTISFFEGQVFVDGDVIGGYTRRDNLDTAWRSLLGEIITLDDGSLASALNDWDPPQSLSGEAGRLAARLDLILERSLSVPGASQDVGDPPGISVSIGGEEKLLSALLSRTGALSGLAEALRGTPLDNFILKIGEDVVVEADEVLEGNLIVVDGDLDIRGQIEGDVVVTGGEVRLLEDGYVRGDLKIADGNFEDLGGTVTGSFLDLDTGDLIERDQAHLEELRGELESEIRRDLRAQIERERHSRPNLFFGFLGNVGSAIAGLLENLVTFLILSVLGVLAVHFQKDRLEVVATTAYRGPVRAGVVGLAGGFFILPIWIVGTIALAITIIGIPALLAWVPLFPIAAGLAILFGFLAVARNVGEWVAEQEYRGLEWIRGSNTFYTVVAGVGALMIPTIAASVSRILGFGILTGLLSFVGSMVTFIAGAVGLGAVLLTRGGKIRPLESYYDFEEEYWADAEPAEARETEAEPMEAPVDAPDAEAEEEGASDAEGGGGGHGDEDESPKESGDARE